MHSVRTRRTILVIAMWCGMRLFACSSPHHDAPVDSDGDDAGEADTLLGDAGIAPDCESGIALVGADVSEMIPTVGIIRWTTTLHPVEEAYVEFGTDTMYGTIAPAESGVSDQRTLLLGLKSHRTYHYRLSVKNEGEWCRSVDRTIETGGVSTALSTVETETHLPEAAQDGFTITTDFSNGHAIILDGEGEYVWWYDTGLAGVNRARMSADGAEMLIGNVNVRNNGAGEIVRTRMDGLTSQHIALPDRHHDFTVLPDGETAFIEYDEDGVGTCDRIVELSETGTRRTVYTIRDDFGHRATEGEWCHSNALTYDSIEDVYYLSVLAFDAILKIDRADSALIWVLGGGVSDFAGALWDRQHGHQILSNGNMLLFNNRSTPEDPLAGSRALEYALVGDDAQLVWEYGIGLVSTTFGDVQRLANGNTLVTFSNAGVIHEVRADSTEVVREMTWSAALGYATRRQSLYGPPEAYR